MTIHLTDADKVAVKAILHDLVDKDVMMLIEALEKHVPEQYQAILAMLTKMAEGQALPAVDAAIDKIGGA